jgi:hypothetical protein
VAIWYELRVIGSAETSGISSQVQEGIAVAESGRLCAISSGHANKFATEEEAAAFLARTSLPNIYQLEAVLCWNKDADDVT